MTAEQELAMANETNLHLRAEFERQCDLTERAEQERDEYRIEADCGLRDFDALELEAGLTAERAERAEARLRECEEALRPYLRQHDLADRDRYCVCSYCNAARAVLGHSEALL